MRARGRQGTAPDTCPDWIAALRAVIAECVPVPSSVGKTRPAPWALQASARVAIADALLARCDVGAALFESRAALAMRKQYRPDRFLSQENYFLQSVFPTPLLDLVDNLVQLGSLCALQGLADEALVYLSKALPLASTNHFYHLAWVAALGKAALHAKMAKTDLLPESVMQTRSLAAVATEPQRATLEAMLELCLASSVSDPAVSATLASLRPSSTTTAVLTPSTAAVASFQCQLVLSSSLQIRYIQELCHSPCSAAVAKPCTTLQQLAFDWLISPHAVVSKTEPASRSQSAPTITTHMPSPALSLDWIAALKVPELRSRLEDLGASSKGLKPALVQRLQALLSTGQEVSPLPATGTAASGTTDVMAADPDALGTTQMPGTLQPLLQAYQAARAGACSIALRAVCLSLVHSQPHDAPTALRYIHHSLGIVACRAFLDASAAREPQYVSTSSCWFHSR